MGINDVIAGKSLWHIDNSYALDGLRKIPDNTIQCAVTSPPYWGLRNYNLDKNIWDGDSSCKHEFNNDVCDKCQAWYGQLGLEPTHQLYVKHLVDIFREVRRVLRADGVAWLNIGDSYCGSHSGATEDGKATQKGTGVTSLGRPRPSEKIDDLKPKDLVMIPARTAIALQEDGWWVRCDIIWDKINAMPESTRDRPTRSHEYIYMLTKSESYYYDLDGIREPYTKPLDRWAGEKLVVNSQSGWDTGTGQAFFRDRNMRPNSNGRNKRSVWSVCTKGFKGAHFAVYPPELITPCILSGTGKGSCCAKCKSPYKRITVKNIEKLKPIDPVVRNGIKLTPEDSAIVVYIENNADGDYRISKKGDKKHNNWVQQPVKSGRTDQYDKKGYSLIHWGDKSTTMGWEKTCKCDTDEKDRCVVLDPFCGSGTTGFVALSNNCKFIGLEPSAEYTKLAKRRIKRETETNLFSGFL